MHGHTSPPAGGDARALRLARLAVATVFFLDGVGVASWVVRIPAVQSRLGLTPGVLGIALLGSALGALVAMPLAGRWVVRRGSGPVTALATFGFAASLVPIPFAPNAALLTLALVLFGALNGVLGVAMNAQAATVERGYRRPIMASFHALFSAGALVGSAIGGVIASAGVPPTWHVAGMAALVALAAPFVARPMLPASADAHVGDAPAPRTQLSLPLAVLGLLAFCVLLAEGAMADWSAVYLSGVTRAGPGTAAAGYAAYSIMMATGRTVGDALTLRLGGATLARLGGALAATGIGLALVAPTPAVAIGGFAAVGSGLATVFPSVLAAASRVAGVASGAGIALVSTVGWLGFLAGPPLIGFVAEATSLRGGLAVVGIATLCVAACAGALRQAGRVDEPLLASQG